MRPTFKVLGSTFVLSSMFKVPGLESWTLNLER